MFRRLLPAALQDTVRQMRNRAPGDDLFATAPTASAHAATAPASNRSATPPAPANPLETYFDANTQGPGLWKWRHYFDAYHRHLQKFVGRSPVVVEVGIYSGGSLPMWRKYFGEGCIVHGVDIEPACRAYEGDGVKVWIGDQADRAFWARFREAVPHVDVLIDDGGHEPDQQRITLEEMLPHLRPGGVYICEDIHGIRHGFTRYAAGLATNLNAYGPSRSDPADPERYAVREATPFQAAIHSMHFYPYVLVVERNETPVRELVAPKHGTQWQPFL